MTSRGFIDLRQNHSGAGGHADDSVWPSFTDIMTVVVMIFLMALVAIILKNNELVSRLQDTVQREQSVSALAAERETESLSLKSRVDRLAAALEALQLERNDLDKTRLSLIDQNSALKNTLTASDQRYASLVADHEVVTDEKRQAQSEAVETANLLAATSRSLEAAEAGRQALAVSIDATAKERERLLAEAAVLEQTLTQSELDIETLASERQILVEERDTLIASEQRLQESLSAKSQSLNNTEERADALETDIALVETDNQELRQTIRELVERESALTISKAALSETLSAKEQQLTEAVARVKVLESNNATLLTKVIETEGNSKTLAASEERLEEQLTLMAEELEKSRAETQALQTLVSEVEADIETRKLSNLELSTERDALIEERATLQEQIASLASGSSAQLETQQAEIARLEQELTLAIAARTNSEQALSGAITDRDKAQATAERIQTSYAQSQKDNQTENDRLSIAMANLEQKLSQLTQLSQQQKAKFSNDLKTLTTSKAQIEATNLSLENRLADSERSFAELEAEKATVEKTLAAMNSQLAKERKTLELAINDAEGRIEQGRRTIAELRESQARADTDNVGLQAEIERLTEQVALAEKDSDRLIAELQSDRQRYEALSNSITEISVEKNKLQETLETSELDNQKLAREQEELRNLLAQSEDEKNALVSSSASLKSERSELYDRLELDEKELEQLRLTFSELKNRYDKLVGPARSPIGRIVVDIRFFRKAGILVIELREPSWQSFREVSEQQLDRRLQRLADQHSNNLYTRIIFPKGNDLTYTEAFQFETRILDRYDYYGRVQAKTPSRG